MARLPRYIKITDVGNTGGIIYKPAFSYNITIKRWGWPIIIFRAFREMNYPWYKWLFYPGLCLKVLIDHGRN